MIFKHLLSGSTSTHPALPFIQRVIWIGAVLAGTTLAGVADDVRYEPKPTSEYFEKFNPRRAPEPGPLLLREGDRLAIIGDSITEQKMYSRIIETYLTVCVPQFQVTTRQFGWGGETAEGFRRRMTNDCLRFEPTLATLCYGMNDHRYRPFDVVNGDWYRENYQAVVRGLKGAGARVVLGSPGCVSKVPTWTHSKAFTLDELNINLCALRDMDIDLAREEDVAFADIYWTMFVAGFEGRNRFGTAEGSYMIGGKDGVHPGWAGHLVMAYAFLHAMGLDGDIGTFTIDLASGRATGSVGHAVDAFVNGELTITSTRYPFCASGEINLDSSIRSGMELVPFQQELNRLLLVVKGGSAAAYDITWGESTRKYTADQLSAGVNLAADFEVNPFSKAFNAVDEAVKTKQEYETRQIKQVFHGDEGKANMQEAVERTEAERAPLVGAIAAARVPVTHTVRIVPAE